MEVERAPGSQERDANFNFTSNVLQRLSRQQPGQTGMSPPVILECEHRGIPYTPHLVRDVCTHWTACCISSVAFWRWSFCLMLARYVSMVLMLRCSISATSRVP